MRDFSEEHRGYNASRSEDFTPHVAWETGGFGRCCRDADPGICEAHGRKGQQSGCYRDYPKQMQMCGMCKFFVGGGMMDHGMMGCGMTGNDMPEAPVIDAGMMGGMMRRGMMGGGCKVVEGRVSRMGWCDLYAPRDGD